MAANDEQTRERSAEPERRTQFADLIRRRRAELNEGLDAFARKAVDSASGVRVKRGWIYRLESGEPVTAPGYEELRALAAACELPVEQLQDAAGQQFFGVDPLTSGSTEATAYVHKLDRLPADQREKLLRLIDTLVPPEE
ncbi:helix-turn-helix domain-containing protein [Streptomyces sp. ME02-6978a]|uniref:helix-turn-helix domain-containing protein n=1 Tax=unclassified Streptomyces TaxID=2593676 RepID=UPI0029B74DBF|nr:MULTISPECIES: helix-turn-helix domain-containing protein [unclassified Streptomyces]MDX3087152.1 helix-turn-helix domain-containing protein [Streptomyces sp. ME12-02E]MDX3335795.1 helix-turn-helix domain-containing protein [Streptomyces sp. ME02-6978a]